MLQIALATGVALRVLDFFFAMEPDNMAVLHAKGKPVSSAERNEICEDTRRRINSKCKGLLDVTSCNYGSETMDYVTSPSSAEA
jgi:hypothetical protein